MLLIKLSAEEVHKLRLKASEKQEVNKLDFMLFVKSNCYFQAE